MKWLPVLLFAITFGCNQPPKPPQPTIRTVAVVDAGGQATGSAYVDDVGGGHTCQLVQGYCDVQMSEASVIYVTVTADGYDPYRQDGVKLPAGNVQIWLGPGCGMPAPSSCVNLPPLIPTFHPLPRLVTNNSVFRQDNGTAWTWIGTSDFDLYHQYLAGGNIGPVLQQRSELGFNVLRVFGSFNGALGHFVPSDFGELFYTQLPRFADAVARSGLYLEFTVFADTTQWLPDPQQQISHWNRVVAAVKGSSNVLLETVNEADQPINRTDSLPNLGLPATTNASHGSNGSQAFPVMGYWHYVGMHFNGAPEWQRKTGHNCGIDLAPTLCIGDENTRPDQDGNPVHFYDAAAGAVLLAGGSTYHSNAGKASVLFTGQDYQFAQQWVAGAKSVPLSCQNQPYSHRTDLEGPGILRVYQRGNDPACIVKIRN